MSVGIENIATASRSLPQPVQDRDSISMRTTRYGDQVVQLIGSGRHSLADEGSYFVANNATPGTPVADGAGASTSFSATRAFFLMNNKDSAGGKRIYLDYMRLILGGTAPATTLSLHFAFFLDYISRDPTTATQRTLVTPVNTNGDSGVQSVCQFASFNSSTMTNPAAGANVRQVGRCVLPTSLGIAGDEYLIKFGGEEIGSYPGMTAIRSAATARVVSQAPPVIIGPGQWFTAHRWWLTETTNIANFEMEVGWWER